MNKQYNFSDHKLLDTRGIIKKYSTLIAFLSNFNFCQKFLKNHENFVDHKLLDAEGNLKNTKLKFLPKNGCGPATPLRVAKFFWEYCFLFFG